MKARVWMNRDTDSTVAGGECIVALGYLAQDGGYTAIAGGAGDFPLPMTDPGQTVAGLYLKETIAGVLHHHSAVAGFDIQIRQHCTRDTDSAVAGAQHQVSILGNKKGIAGSAQVAVTGIAKDGEAGFRLLQPRVKLVIWYSS